MVSTIIHVLYGIMIALLFKLNIPLFLIFTNLPDLDCVVDIFTNGTKYHRYVLHNIFAFFLILIISSFFFSFKLIFIALFLHFFLDLFLGKTGYLYPLTKKKFGLFPLKGNNPLWTYIFYEGNIHFTIISLIIFIVFILFYFF